MTEQVEEICTINVMYLVVKNERCWWLILELPSHSFFSFFLRQTNSIDLSIQRGSKSVSIKGQTIFCTRILIIIMKILRNFRLEVLVSP